MALAAVAGPWRCALCARRGPENKCAESALTASPSQLQPGGLPLPAEAFTCEPAASWPSVCLPDLCSKVWTDPDRSLSPSGKRSCSVPMGSARPGSSDGDPAGNSPVSLALGCAASQGMWERSALQRQLFLALLGGRPCVCSPRLSSSLARGGKRTCASLPLTWLLTHSGSFSPIFVDTALLLLYLLLNSCEATI